MPLRDKHDGTRISTVTNHLGKISVETLKGAQAQQESGRVIGKTCSMDFAEHYIKWQNEPAVGLSVVDSLGINGEYVKIVDRCQQHRRSRKNRFRENGAVKADRHHPRLSRRH
jgi:hypothetical protein